MRSVPALALVAIASVACVTPATTVPTAPSSTGEGATASPPATRPVASERPSLVPAATVWQQLRATMSAGMPIAAPLWLPDRFVGADVSLRSEAGSAAAPGSYTVTYRAGAEELAFWAGPRTTTAYPPPHLGASGIGIHVRQTDAAAYFPSDIWSNARARGERVVRWFEGVYELRISSDTIGGDDLLRVAWSLDQRGAPAPARPAPRTKSGACASATSPEATARRVVELIGRRDPAAIGDCFSIENGAFVGWASLPTASLVSIDRLPDVGGRAELQVTWRFAADPGGAWNPVPTNFFLIGLEDGMYRVFSVGTAPSGRIP